MKMNARMLMRIAVVIIALGWFGWSWWGRHHPNARVDAAPAVSVAVGSSAQAKPVQPAPPATLHMGRLILTACELGQSQSAVTTPAFCAKFPVPENRADPHSRVIDLKLAIVKSASQIPAHDLVVYLAGGPGQSAIRSYAQLKPAFAPLLKHHDVLLLDQRGTGGSHPLQCPQMEKQMRQLADSASDAEVAKLVGECAQEVEKTADPRYYTTTDAVADLEAVRQALGAPKLDLVGVSYGTRVAQHFSSTYPHAVRSLVLDGVVPNQLIIGETFAEALQHSLKLQAAGCSATPACQRAYGNWYATLHQLYAKLKAGPAQTVTFADPYTGKPISRSLSADNLALVARMFSYSRTTAALLPLAVSQAAQGNYAPLMGQSDLLSGDLSGSMQGGMQRSVICAEDAPLLRPRPQDADLLLGNSLIKAFQAECAAWPHAPMPKDFHAAFKSSLPTLLISGARDPVTPPAYAAEVLQGLSDGRSLVVKGMGHAEAINAGCMPNLVTQFIDKLQPRKLDARCLDKLGPIPAFVNFNGAAP